MFLLEFFLEISLYKIKQIKIVLNVPSQCDQHVSFIWLIALAINSSTMLNRDVRSWCTFLDLGPSLKGKVFTWASSSQTKIWAWTEKAGTKYHPKLRSFLQWLAPRRRVSFFKGLAHSRSTMFQWKTPHLRVHAQHKLDLMDLKKKEDTDLGGHGRGWI